MVEHTGKLEHKSAILLLEADRFRRFGFLTLEISLMHAAEIDEVERSSSHDNERFHVVGTHSVA